MSHYFVNDKNLESNKQTFKFSFLDEEYIFESDNGVFAKSGIDYGSKALLNAIIKTNELQDDLLDVGCGYGTIGLILKKRYSHANVDMIDINERAIALAKSNASLNHLKVNIFLSNIYENVVKDDYSDIITNPPIRAGKKVIYEIFEKAYDHLKLNGSLWVVIRKQHGALSAQNKINEVFGNCDIIAKDKGFFILRAKKTK